MQTSVIRMALEIATAFGVGRSLEDDMPDKRQFTSISVLTLCLLTAALLLVACSGREHTHTYEARETIAATCETEGEAVQVCSECGKVSAEPTVIKPLGHLWSDGEITVDATCEEDGLMTYTCTRTGCGKDKTEKVKKLGHDWQEETVLEPATCEKAGISSADCSRCGSARRPSSRTGNIA